MKALKKSEASVLLQKVADGLQAVRYQKYTAQVLGKKVTEGFNGLEIPEEQQRDLIVGNKQERDIAVNMVMAGTKFVNPKASIDYIKEFQKGTKTEVKKAEATEEKAEEKA
jgi:hypothetical protein